MVLGQLSYPLGLYETFPRAMEIFCQDPIKVGCPYISTTLFYGFYISGMDFVDSSHLISSSMASSLISSSINDSFLLCAIVSLLAITLYSIEGMPAAFLSLCFFKGISFIGLKIICRSLKVKV